MYRVNPYHLLSPSPWPITGSLGALCLVTGLAYWMKCNSMIGIMAGMLVIIVTSINWWRDVIREATYQGFHTSPTARGLRVGMILFIVSEVFFFFSFFWAFFHSSLSPSVEIGSVWPPAGIITLSPWGVPLLNTLVLLSSGVTVTWAHHSLLANSTPESVWALLFTILLGVYFTYLQACEYAETSFSISDSVYGAVFFVATGFHGAHVIIGTTFLAVCFFRTISLHFSDSHHLGFEAAAWYWHFVDVVWLFLYVSIYWWGG